MNSVSAVAVLADEAGKGGPSGLFVIIALSVATYFLIRSMSKHLKKVPPSFDDGPDENGDGAASASSDEPAGDRPV